MPRTGPRPYDCVRRAWHSDRHHPIRGSVIQEIFKLANEVHCVSTRKNREWQKKLPFVVLKAEEIMYSKANSEAEYMNLNTLWERANDAIDIIIRKDETTENEDLLKPCIEAALNLGCVPRKASRSQRNNSPRCYLSYGAQESTDTSTISPSVPNGSFRPLQQGISFHLPLPVAPIGNLKDNTQRFVAWCPSLAASVAANCGLLGAKTFAPSQEFRGSVPISCHKYSLPSARNICADQDKHLNSPSEPFSLSGTGLVYPLHYMEKIHNVKQQCPLERPVSLNCNIPAACDSSTLHMEGEAGLPCDPIPIFDDEFHFPPVETSNSYQDNASSPSLDAFIWSSAGNLQPSFEDHTNNKLRQHPACTSEDLNCIRVASNSLPSPLMRVGDAAFVHNFLDVNEAEGATIETSNSLDLNVDLHDLEYDVSLRLRPPPSVRTKNTWYR